MSEPISLDQLITPLFEQFEQLLGVMIGLILLSVVLFGDEVAAGPLQVSMTLATLFALGLASLMRISPTVAAGSGCVRGVFGR